MIKFTDESAASWVEKCQANGKKLQQMLRRPCVCWEWGEKDRRAGVHKVWLFVKLIQTKEKKLRTLSGGMTQQKNSLNND